MSYGRKGGREGKGEGELFALVMLYLVGLFHVGLAPAPLIAHRWIGEGTVGVCVAVGVGWGGAGENGAWAGGECLLEQNWASERSGLTTTRHGDALARGISGARRHGMPRCSATEWFAQRE